MVRMCPKCGFENDAAIGSPTEACPKCGVIYAKARVSTASQAKPSAAAANGLRREMRLPLWPTVACAICLVVGFLAGREQMRYQVANAFAGALTHAFDGVSHLPGATPSARESPVRQPQHTPDANPVAEAPAISAKLLKKGFREQDFSGSHIVKAAVTFTVEYRNETNKDVRAFDGVLSFNDLLGNRIYAAKLTISDPIGVGQAIQWNGEMEYNQFISDHAKLRGYDLKDTIVTLNVHKILFADGSSDVEGEGS